MDTLLGVQYFHSVSEYLIRFPILSFGFRSFLAVHVALFKREIEWWPFLRDLGSSTDCCLHYDGRGSFKRIKKKGDEAGSLYAISTHHGVP